MKTYSILARTEGIKTADFGAAGYNEMFAFGGKQVTAFHKKAGATYHAHVNGEFRSFDSLQSLAVAIHCEKTAKKIA